MPAAISPLIQTPVAQAAGEHDYFNSLVSRPEHWKSYSLRSTAQLNYPKNGGYANGNSGNLDVTYNPSNDYDLHRQDAAKVVIPTWNDNINTLLARPMSATDTTIWLKSTTGSVTGVTTGINVRGIYIKIGDEIVRGSTAEYPLDRATGEFVLSARGVNGSTAAAHSVGEGLQPGKNSLGNQIRVPLGTTDGNKYLVTWDGYWTDSYLNTGLTNHKAFQFSSGGDNIWLEPQTNFAGGGAYGAGCFDESVHVAGIGIRSYNAINGDPDYSKTAGNSARITNGEPIAPKVGVFCLYPNRWTRFWMEIEQRANDYDIMSFWVADEVQNAVKIYDKIPVSVRTATGGIDKFWLEFNTSTAYLPPERLANQRDLVAYIRNVAALKNYSSADSFLIKPGAAGTLPPPVTDTTAPTISLTAPATGETVSGTATLSANASDNIAVAGVQFKLNGLNIGTEDSTSPYSISWNSATVINGSYALTASARDFAGNTTISASRSIVLSNSVVVPPPPPPPSNQLPQGALDEVNTSGLARGWSFDPDASTAVNNVHIYVDSPAGAGKTPITTTTTNKLRTDVNTLKGITGNHGFEYTIPPSLKDGKNHTIYAYAIDINDSTKSTLLIGSPKSFNFAAPINPPPVVNPPPVNPPPPPVVNPPPPPSTGGGGGSTRPTPPPVVKPTPVPSGSRNPRGKLVNHNGTIYFLGADVRYPFPSAEVFLSWGSRFEDVVPANSGDIAIPVGPVVEFKTTQGVTRHPRATLVNHNGTIYFLGADIRYPFPSAAVFFSWGSRFQDVVPANSGDIAMPIGPIVEMKR